MFQTIFQNAVNGGYKSEISHLLALAKNFKLFTDHEMKLFTKNYFINNYRINRIPLLNKLFKTQAPQQNSYRSMMGTVAYTGEIKA
jgi:hypothetical protein